jgi:hypothetical protein
MATLNSRTAATEELDEDPRTAGGARPPKKKAVAGKKKCNKSSRERKTNLILKIGSGYHVMNNTLFNAFVIKS